MSEQLNKDLQKEIKAGSVVLVVGAGVSIAATNSAPVASWDGLLKDGVRYCRDVAGAPEPWANLRLAQIETGETEEFITAADLITTRLGGREGGEFARWLKESIGSLQIQDATLLQLLCALGSPIVTTNYDSLLEQATGLPSVTWKEPRRIDDFIRDKRQAVVHIHGHWDEPESVVLGVRSYEGILGDDPAQFALRALLSRRTLLFIGVGVEGGLSDPNFGALRKWIAEVYKASTHRHYVLVKDDEVEAARNLLPLEGRILPIGYGPQHSDLVGFLQTLAPPSTVNSSALSSDVPQVFISYVHENWAQVNRLYGALKTHGIKVWLDRNEIMPGMLWKTAIRWAIEAGDFFICCFSTEYNARPTSYVNEELNLAIEQLQRRPNNQVWFIPVVLSACEVPDWDIGAGRTLRDIQWADLGADWDEGIRRILRVIQPEAAPVSAVNDDDTGITVAPAQAQLPKGLASHDDKIISETDGAEMVLIPAGEFQMGSNDGGDNEKPAHTVYLDAFYIDKYEVINAQYRQFVQDTGHPEPKGYGYIDGSWQDGFEPWKDSRFNGDNQPVVCVSWYDAAAYCQWAGKRLPTEAEWEKTARGGLIGKKYPWGDSIDPSQANYSSGGTKPVGSYPPNGYGLYDMAGNVWEWCLDEYQKDFYKNSPKENPLAGEEMEYVINNFTNVKSLRVVRGGSWDGLNPYDLRVAGRGDDDPSYRGDNVGFRCAGSVTP